MKIGYARVSTIEQNLKPQIEQLKQAGAEKIYSEKYTGTTTERPVFDEVMKTLKSGDTLIVTRTQEGKAYARKHDPSYRDGRPRKFTPEQLELAYKLRQQGYTYRMIEKSTGISTATQRRYFKEIEAKKKVNDDRKSN
ncbi:recombinase family protein [Lactobacillus gallinarum]|uniref:recombinase family protein n=1 Tax=Lactobacillus gallinarum TaxID=52242 RepID=UPI0025A3B7A0|nr:recombinase family protein [Lactobacillus gallinarum]MDM8282126.1 recombinase family protein [Lactobacillus gallinarum]